MIQCQQSHGDTVKAVSRQRLIGNPVELGVAGKPVQAGTAGRQSASDGHTQHNVPLVLYTRVPGGVPIGTAGLQLVAKGRLVHEDIHQNSDDDGNENAAVDL